VALGWLVRVRVRETSSCELALRSPRGSGRGKARTHPRFVPHRSLV